MKKILFQFLAALVLLAGCSSIDELYDELDQNDPGVVKDLVITLTDDDYDVADELCSCSGFGNFSDLEDVKTYVPSILANNYPQLGLGSSALVTYDFYNGSSPDLRGDYFERTVTAEEYDALGYSFGNFDNLPNDIPIWAAYHFGDLTDGDYVDVTHEYFSGGSTTTVTSRGVYTVSNGWQYAYPLPADVYGGFFASESPPDFSDEDEGKAKIPLYLNENHVFFAEQIFDGSLTEGDVLVVGFLHSDGAPETEAVGLYVFSGEEWLLYDDHYQVTQQTLQFSYLDNIWVPDNTVKHTLTFNDYQWIIAEFAATYPDGTDNMATFGNFSQFDWEDADIDVVVTALMEELYEQEDGQKFIVTYSIYRDPTTDETVTYEYNAGVWTIVSSTRP